MKVARPDGRRFSALSVAVIVGVLAGVALRVWVLVSSAAIPDADEAVWGLMAKHALDGELDVFFWGQAYGGTQETFLTAGVVAVAGQSPVALRIVPMVLYAVAAVLTWRIGIRTVGEPSARLAAVIVWVWPAYAVWKSTRAHGFYGSAIVLGLFAVLLALRLRERDSRLDAALLGLVCGLGWWATSQVAILALPAVAWLVWRRPVVLRLWWLAVPAAVLGALPALVANVQNDWYSFVTGERQTTPLIQLKNLFVTNLPAALGLRRPFSLEWIPHAAIGGTAYALTLVGFVVLLVRSRSRHKLEPLLLTALVLPLFYAVSPYASLNTEPRYLFLLVPVLALLLVAMVPAGRAALVAAAVALAFSVAGIAKLDAQDVAVSFVTGDPVPADLSPLVRLLDREGVQHVLANYWIAWRITYESDERILAVESGTGKHSLRAGRVEPVSGDPGRYPPFYRSVIASRDAAYVFSERSSRDLPLRDLLRTAGYRRVTVGGFVVFLPPAP